MLRLKSGSWPTSSKFDEVPGVPPPGPTVSSPCAGGASTTRASARARGRRVHRIAFPPSRSTTRPEQGEIAPGSSYLSEPPLGMSNRGPRVSRHGALPDLQFSGADAQDMAPTARCGRPGGDAEATTAPHAGRYGPASVMSVHTTSHEEGECASDIS